MAFRLKRSAQKAQKAQKPVKRICAFAAFFVTVAFPEMLEPSWQARRSAATLAAAFFLSLF
jgi:hypothetical protein